MFDFIFPHHCIFCKSLSKRKIHLCTACESELPYCNNQMAVFNYQSPIDKLLLGLKFGQKLAYAKLLGELAGKKMQDYYKDNAKPELIIPVPLHPKRLKERGYNQALELVRCFSKEVNIPIDKFSCKRVKHTLPQLNLSESERKTNVKNAFIINKKIDAKHVIVFDDVVTTGSTVAELCRVLQEQGVEKIDVWCVAKT